MPGYVLIPLWLFDKGIAIAIPYNRGRDTMNRLPVTEKDIKKILEQREDMISAIHARLEYLNRDVSQTSDIIEAVSLRSKALSDMPKGGGGHKDLFTEYEKYHSLLDKRYHEYAVGIHQLILQEERIERVWICFNALSSDAYKILYSLYVEKELYQTVESESGLTHPIFEKKRKRAMQDIIRLYNSTLDNKCIFEIPEEDTIPGNINREENQQLSIMDMLADE